MKLAKALRETKKGVGPSWTTYRPLGVTRTGIGEPKEPVGKSPGRYKLVRPGTIVYNPMRVLLGSIGIMGPDQKPGIISPDYVVFATDESILDPFYFFGWLKSSSGIEFINKEARGAVRQRLRLKTLGDLDVSLPEIAKQRECGQRLIETLAIIDKISSDLDLQKSDLEAHRVRVFNEIPPLK